MIDGSLKIEKFEDGCQDKPYPAISDHYGLSIEIEIDNENRRALDDSNDSLLSRMITAMSTSFFNDSTSLFSEKPSNNDDSRSSSGINFQWKMISKELWQYKHRQNFA